MQNQFFAPFSPNTYLLIMVIDRTPARIHLLDSIIYNWSAANLAGRYYLLAGRRWREDKHPAFVGREASRRRAPPPNSYSQSMTMSSTGTATTTASHRNDRGITTSSSTTISISAALTKECLQRHFPGRRYTNEAVELSSEFLKLFIIEARRRAAIEVREHTCVHT